MIFNPIYPWIYPLIFYQDLFQESFHEIFSPIFPKRVRILNSAMAGFFYTHRKSLDGFPES